MLAGHRHRRFSSSGRQSQLVAESSCEPPRGRARRLPLHWGIRGFLLPASSEQPRARWTGDACSRRTFAVLAPGGFRARTRSRAIRRHGTRLRLRRGEHDRQPAFDCSLIRPSTSRRSTGPRRTARLVPVSLTLTRSRWRVADVGGIQGVTHHQPRSPSSGACGTSGRGVDCVPDAVTVEAVQDVGGIPSNYLTWMQGAVAAECPGLPWEVLAGIAKVESDFGESTLPGVASGSNAAGAEGPMQFEPATFRAYATVAPGGADPASPYDAADAIYSAARLLCADGGGTPGLLDTAIFDYNHSDAYVAMVLAYASAYEQGGGATVQLADTTGSAQGIALGSVVVADAEAYLGTPYVWGGEKPGVGFDCSGLVQWVYAEAGISLPRVAQDQFDAGPHVPAGATLYPGDLVFFGSGPQAVEHVGIYVGNGEMIDAPYTGVDVRFDRVSSVSLGYVGATRPEIPDLTTGAGVPVISAEPADLLADTTSSTGSSRSATAAKARRHADQWRRWVRRRLPNPSRTDTHRLREVPGRRRLGRAHHRQDIRSNDDVPQRRRPPPPRCHTTSKSDNDHTPRRYAGIRQPPRRCLRRLRRRPCRSGRLRRRSLQARTTTTSPPATTIVTLPPSRNDHGAPSSTTWVT